tara:strand:+ start:423 stop:1955 length:1533 start_codon:yes stop_codon:yes gene_type:complete
MDRNILNREKSIQIIHKLYNDFGSNMKLSNKILHYIEHNLTNIITKMNETETQSNIINNKISEFIEDFFSEDNSYFYIQQKETYVYYNDVKYQIIDEDEIILRLYNIITNEEQDIKSNKHKICREILKQMKTHKLEKSIPESTTISYLNTFFIPNLLSNKNEMKYLYTIIGDCILKRNMNQIFYFNIEAKGFFEILYDIFLYYIGINLSLNIKYKYHTEHNYNNCRILTFNIAIKNRSFWETFLKDNIFNIYVVSCYYSIRYGNSEEYLNTLLDINKSNILFLKNNIKEDIINIFINNMLIKSTSNEIKIDDMYFLWKIFIKQQNIPNIMYKNNFYSLLDNIIPRSESNKSYIGYSSEYLNNIRFFQKFWSETMVKNEGDTIEINELYSLYREWFPKYNGSSLQFDEDKMYDLINYFYPEIIVKDDKHILNMTNILWDKQYLIETGLDLKFNKTIIERKISFHKLYKLYCSFSKSNNNRIVSKNYFINTINKIIPDKYIKNNMVLKEFWN